MTASEFQANFNSFSALLKNFSLKLTRDVNEAKDLYQETAYRAFKNHNKFAAGTNLKAWLMTIMKNIFINDYRKKSKSNVIFDQSEEQYRIIKMGPTVRNESGSRMLLDELEEMIHDLEDTLKVPFLMHYEGYKYREIADTLGLPVGTVKSRIFFARKSLQSTVLKKYESREMLMNYDV